MAKFTPWQKLAHEARQSALLELCQAMVVVKQLPDAAKVLGDLLSEQELDMIAKRLQIAKLLIQKKTYDDISIKLKVSTQTIARVNLWLQQGGSGFRIAITQAQGMKIPKWIPWKTNGDEWSQLKRRYPLVYWPQLLVDEIVRSANNRQRIRLLKTLNILKTSGKGKKEAFYYLEQLLSQSRRSPRRPQELTHTPSLPLNKIKSK